IPVIDNNQLLSSTIQKATSKGKLINHTGLITLNEVCMSNRATFACMEEVCRHIMNNNRPFGGKAIVLLLNGNILGDFQQTCPIIPGGTHAQI
ncbi:hypothetical protein BJV77DRAFT_918890, partial [Russula vinacea]